MSYDILIAYEADYDEESDETEVAKRVAGELDLGDPESRIGISCAKRSTACRASNWHVDVPPSDAADIRGSVEQLMHLPALGVRRSDEVPIFYWCAEDWLKGVEEGVRR